MITKFVNQNPIKVYTKFKIKVLIIFVIPNYVWQSGMVIHFACLQFEGPTAFLMLSDSQGKLQE